MLKLTLILCFVSFLNEPPTEQPNYLDYHRDVIKTEQLIIEHRYKEALSELNNVFNSYDFIFLRDYKVAAQLAVFIGDEKAALNYLQLAISKGWELKDIKKNSIMKPIFNNPDWEIIEANYDSTRNNYLQSIDEGLRLQVHEMFKRDQKKAIGALLRIGNKAQEKYGENKFAPHSESQLAELDTILIRYGYPGEQLIGNDSWMSTIFSHHNSVSKEYVLKDTLFQYFRPKFINAIKRGEMSPFEFTIIEDWKIAVENDHKKSAYGFLGAIQSESMLNEIDQNRINVGLRSISIRNALVDIETETGINFYLPGDPWQGGKITVANKP